MRAYHLSPRRNRASIRKHGICTRFSKGRRKAVWLVPESMIPWAAEHVAARHGCRLEDVIVFEVEVPWRSLRAHKGNLWWMTENVPPGCILGVMD